MTIESSELRKQLIVMMAGLALASAGALGQTPTFQVIHRFTGDDGSTPLTPLLLHNGSLYGTTFSGGPGAPFEFGAGTAFKLDIASGQVTGLIAFLNNPAIGSGPRSGLIGDAQGNVYGATCCGGANGEGTLYKIDSSGDATVLYSFTGNTTAGTYPIGSLVRTPGGAIYGVTFYSEHCCGAIWEFTPSSTLRTRYKFDVGEGPTSPSAGLLWISPYFYGTTMFGGAYNSGTVYQFDPATNTETTLYSFTGGSDGNEPMSELITDGNGNLFGTASTGGLTSECSAGCGVVFELNIATGQETILHAFSGADGSLPEAALMRDSAGTLYGTSYSGGAGNFGTVFKIDSSGRFSSLYSFTGGADGAYPQAPLVLGPGNILYGTAAGGGRGFGTVFAVVAP